MGGPMRYLLLALLAGCSHTITLYPKGGGSQAIGWLNDGSQNMEVTIDGATYSGRYNERGGQARAVLVGAGRTVTCEFAIEIITGGNGMCVDANNRFYDMVIR
jgi:hypothetical protein